VPTWLVLTFYGGLAVLQLGVGVAHASSPRVHVVGSGPLDSLGMLAIGSSVVTALLGGLHAWLNHCGKLKRLDLEIAEAAHDREDKMRLAAVEKRITLIEKGIPCEVESCPVIEMVKGRMDWDKLPPLKRPNFDFDPTTAKPSDDTVDIPG
jgi:hypothetical protein